jgi:6-phosphogluconolactonase
MVEIQVYPTLPDLAKAARDLIIRAGIDSLQVKGHFSIVLAGGSTPSPVYKLLADVPISRFDWSKVHFFWGDERCVPPDHPESNYHMAKEILLKHIAVPEANIHRISGELNPFQAATNYQTHLESFFDGSPGFDLTLLGMGDDGHTASLFPGTDAICEKNHWVIAHRIMKLKAWRISMTPVILNKSKLTLFMVAGENKASTLQNVLEGNYQPEIYPAQIIQPETGSLTWMVDQKAAAKLQKT